MKNPQWLRKQRVTRTRPVASTTSKYLLPVPLPHLRTQLHCDSPCQLSQESNRARVFHNSSRNPSNPSHCKLHALFHPFHLGRHPPPRYDYHLRHEAKPLPQLPLPPLSPRNSFENPSGSALMAMEPSWTVSTTYPWTKIKKGGLEYIPKAKVIEYLAHRSKNHFRSLPAISLPRANRARYEE